MNDQAETSVASEPANDNRRTALEMESDAPQELAAPESAGMIFAKSRTMLAVLWLGLVITGYIFFTQAKQSALDEGVQRHSNQLADQSQQMMARLQSWQARHFAPLEALADELSSQFQKTSSGNVLRRAVSSKAAFALSWAEKSGIDGLVVMTPDLSYLYQSERAPAMTSIEAANLIQLTTKPTLSGPLIADGVEQIIFAAPILLEEKAAAYVLGFVPSGEMLKHMLDDMQSRTGHAHLIMRRGAEAHYLTPLANEQAPNPDRDNTQLISSQAISGARGMVVGTDDAGAQSLAHIRQLDASPWILIHQISRTEALSETQLQWDTFERGYWIVSGVFTVIMIILWWQARHTTAREVEDDRQMISGRMNRQEALLELISQNSPNAMYITNWDQELCYINHAMSKRFGLPRREIIGRTLNDVLEDAEADPILKGNRRAAATQSIVIERFVKREDDHVISAIQRSHIPIEDIPMPDSEDHMPGVLITEVDITEYAQTNQKMRGTMQHVIDTLVQLVDERDPHTAYHSESVAFIAEGIGKEMDLEESLLDSAVTAGRLMNIGKLFVSIDLLTSSKLNENERDQIRNSIHSSAHILRGIAFDGPVIETLEQMQERVDGKGPQGLRRGEILITARIVAVANSFVAMTSPRAYREAMSVDDAIKSLMEGIDKRYDRSTVAAMVNYLDHRDGRTRWETLKAKHLEALGA
ncbi:MAG: PAS domain S-box protein [Rickettsiales bacterium]|nr:PAS domain S-box protein [Rickettsiales bacterium]